MLNLTNNEQMFILVVVILICIFIVQQSACNKNENYYFNDQYVQKNDNLSPFEVETKIIDFIKNKYNNGNEVPNKFNLSSTMFTHLNKPVPIVMNRYMNFINQPTVNLDYLFVDKNCLYFLKVSIMLKDNQISEIGIMLPSYCMNTLKLGYNKCNFVFIDDTDREVLKINKNFFIDNNNLFFNDKTLIKINNHISQINSNLIFEILFRTTNKILLENDISNYVFSFLTHKSLHNNNYFKDRLNYIQCEPTRDDYLYLYRHSRKLLNVNLIDYLKINNVQKNELNYMIERYEYAIRNIYNRYINDKNQATYYDLIQNKITILMLHYVGFLLCKLINSSSIKLTNIIITNENTIKCTLHHNVNSSTNEYNVTMYFSATLYRYGIPFGPGKLNYYINPSMDYLNLLLSTYLNNINRDFVNELTTIVINPYVTY